MNPQSMFSIRHWKLPEILFVASACFAMGAIGFFIAIFLQLHSSSGSTLPTGTYANTQDVPVADKARALSILSHSTTDSTNPENPTKAAPSVSQASPTDALAAQKLKLLQQMNAK